MKHDRAYYRRIKHQPRGAAAAYALRKKLLWIAIAAQFALHAVLLTAITASNPWMADAPYVALYLPVALFDLAVTILLYFVWPIMMIPVALAIPLSLVQPIILLSALLSSRWS